jgi:hypothetical protein
MHSDTYDIVVMDVTLFEKLHVDVLGIHRDSYGVLLVYYSAL